MQLTISFKGNKDIPVLKDMVINYSKKCSIFFFRTNLFFKNVLMQKIKKTILRYGASSN
jgi:hypothetical protein